MQTLPSLPNNVEELKALLTAQIAMTDAVIVERDALRFETQSLKASKRDDQAEIVRLGLLIDKLKRMLFGQKSERLERQIDQLSLELEELHINQGVRQSQRETRTIAAHERKVPSRQPLPEHLPRETQEILPAESACPSCGSDFVRLGEDVSETLEWVPAHFKVIRHVRPKFTCRCCDTIVQAPAPSRPIPRSYAGPGLLSHVMVSKYLDHLPIYRQTQIYARQNVELSDSTLGDWVGGVHTLLEPLISALREYVFVAQKLHADDTPIQVLAPGTGKTKTGRLWVYARDDRPSGGTSPPAVWFRYSPDRKGIHPQTHLKAYQGILQADAYAGFNAVFESGQITEAACWAHARRKFYDIHAAGPTRTTTHVLQVIGELYDIEATIRGKQPEERKRVRQAQSKPIVQRLHDWLAEQLPTLSKKSVTADAIRYTMNHWQALTRFLDDGRIEADNNTAERALRSVAVGRNNVNSLIMRTSGGRTVFH